jgi:glycerol-3-phosphate acyltransferase PlsY
LHDGPERAAAELRGGGGPEGIAVTGLAAAGPGTWLGLLGGAYLLGAVPFSFLLVRWKTGLDVRRVGSGNVGATNAMRAAGKGAGATALVLDVCKGALPVVIGHALKAPPVVISAAATAAVLGHMYSVFLRLQGGKGVATAAGALGALAPSAMGLALIVFVVLVAWKRYVSLASMAAACAFPLFVLLLAARDTGARAEIPFLISSTLVPALIVWKHRGNLRRLRAGREPRLGERRKEGGS